MVRPPKTTPASRGTAKATQSEVPPAKRARPRKAAERVLSPAMARNAMAMHLRAQVAHRARGRELIELIRARRSDVTVAFLDIAEALVALDDERVIEALGRKSFAEVCEKDIDISMTKARQLMALASSMPRRLVMKLGQDRASAVLDLVLARGGIEKPTELLAQEIALPSGKTLRVASAPTASLREAATELRRARPKRTAGRTISPDEQAQLEALQASVTAVPALSGVRFKLIAMGTKRGPDVEIRLPFAELAALGAVLKAKR